MGHYVDPKRREKIIELAKQKKTQAEIHREVGGSLKVVRDTIRKAGITPYKYVCPDYLKKDEVIRLYEEGLTLSDIARHLSIPLPRVYYMIRDAGFDTSANYKTQFGGRAERRLSVDGYWLVYKPDHVHANCDGYVMEHIMKASDALGRKLKKNEVVHHVDCNRANNANSNLMVLTRSYHSWLHHRMGHAYVEMVMNKRVPADLNRGSFPLRSNKLIDQMTAT